MICRALPDFFVFENVKGLYRTARHREFFEELKMQFREHGYSMTEQLVNALEYGAPQDRDRIILIGFHHTAIERLHLPESDGKLLDFPWEAHKRYNLQTVKSLPWPTKTPYHENVETEMPQGIIEDLTVLHWWKQNHVDTHPNKDMYFRPRAGLVRFQTKDEGDVEKNVIRDYIDGAIHQLQHMVTMKFMCIHFCHEEYQLQKHWPYKAYRQILYCHPI